MTKRIALMLLMLPPLVLADEAASHSRAAITVTYPSRPEMKEWAERIQKVADAEYPKIVAMLPSEGFTAPDHVEIRIEGYKGVAATGGTTVHLSAAYFKKHPDDVGAVVHELVHVVQHYPKYDAGWLVEGIADYVRFYHYEPESARPHVNPETDHFRKGYRVAAAFLEWISRTYDKNLVTELNATLRQGTYSDEVFKQLTKHALDDLWAQYKQTLRDNAATQGN